jgi:hypothetical protein
LALAHRAAGCLPVRPAGDELHEREVEAARSAMGGGVVCDTSVLNVLGYIREVVPLLLATFSAISYPVPSRRDLHAALESAGRHASGSLSWDVSTGRPVITDSDPTTEDRIREQLTWMSTVSDGLRLRDWSALQSIPSIDWDRDDQALAWLAPLDIAKTEGCPLFSDDVVQRQLAWNSGVSAFGSVALLEVLMETGQISDAVHGTTLLTLKREFCVDFPLDGKDLMALAHEDGFGAGPASMTFTRAMSWVDHRVAHAEWSALCGEAGDRDRNLVPHWVWAAVSGVCEAFRPELARFVAAHVLVTAVAATKFDPETFAHCVDATRAAGSAHALDDPLPVMLDITQSLLLRGSTQEETAALLAQLVAGLEGRDRDVARRWLFGIDEAEGEAE